MSVPSSELKNLQRALSKYSKLGSSPGLAPLVNLDMGRIARGGAPLGLQESADMISSANTLRYRSEGPFTAPSAQAIAPIAHQGFFQNLVSDIRQVAAGIVRLPQTLISEATQLPQLPGDIATAFSSGSLKGMLHGLATSPGLRMIPGSFTVGSLTGPGGWHDLAHHPVFTLLDMLPTLDKASEGLFGEHLAPAMRGLKERLYSHAENIYAPTPHASGYMPRQGWARFTPQALSERYISGGRLRDFWARYSQKDRLAHDIMSKKLAESTANITDRFGGDPARIKELMIKAQHGDPAEIKAMALSDSEHAAVKYYNDMTHIERQRMETEGMGLTHNGEFYGIDRGKTLMSYRHETERLSSKIQKAQDKIQTLTANRTPTSREQGSITRSNRDIVRWSNRQKVLAAKMDNWVAKHAPERWAPNIDRLTIDKLKDLKPEHADLIEHAFFKQAGFTDKEVARHRSAVEETWQRMEADGLHPMYVHHVQTTALNRVLYPKLYVERIPQTIGAVKARAFDTGNTWIPDLAVSLTDLQRQWVERDVTTKLVEDWHQAGYIRDLPQVRAEYSDYARRLAAKRGVDPEVLTEELMRKDGWRNFDPQGWGGRGFPKMSAFAQGKVIPGGLDKAVRDLYREPGLFRRSIRAPMKLFITSVLGLNPGFMVHTTLSGGLLMLGETGPGVFKYFDDARKMMNDGTWPEGMSHTQAGLDLPDRTVNYLAGRTIGRMATEHSELFKISGALNKAQDALWKIPRFTHDLYKSMAYLSGKDKALTAGMTADAAERAGLELAHKIMQDWDNKTPFERTVVRSIMPFYGWVSFVMQYAFRYPFDHPLRAGIISNFARNEMADWGTGLPQNLYNMLFIGQPDAHGKILAARMTGAVPFLQLGNYFTLAGFASHLNPLIHAGLEVFGINPQTASSDLYPTTHYDPVTGQIVADHPSALGSLLPALVPQLGGIANIIGMTNDMRTLRQTNPAAWKAQVLAGFGLSWLPQRIDLGAKVEAAERARYETFRHALDALVLHGDASLASRYPELSPLISRYAKR